MRIARIRISTQLIASVLKMPKNTKILAGNGERIPFEETFELLVESPDLHEIKEGDPIPELQPTYNLEKFKWEWNQKTP